MLILAALLLAAAAPPPGREADRLPMPRPRLGFALNCHHIGDLTLYLRSVDQIAELGANCLLIVTPMFQQRVDSTAIEFDAERCPTDAQLTAILTHARQRGLRTTLMPIVLITQLGPDDWRGTLRPSDWNDWWRSYRSFLDRFISIANVGGADVLCLGSELNTTEDQPDRWRDIVNHIRARFRGRLTYTANWDRYDQVPFWKLVDEMSVSAYFELGLLARPSSAVPAPALPLSADDQTPEFGPAVRPDKQSSTPSVERMAKAWSLPRDKLLAFAEKVDRPLVLTELGYPSLPWAGAHPWNYTAAADVPADGDAQARCYQAFFSAWREAILRPGGHFAGFHCYHWDPYHRGGPRDIGYGVDGKPALEVIRSAFAAMKPAASPALEGRRPGSG